MMKNSDVLAITRKGVKQTRKSRLRTSARAAAMKRHEQGLELLPHRALSTECRESFLRSWKQRYFVAFVEQFVVLGRSFPQRIAHGCGVANVLRKFNLDTKVLTS